MQIWHPKRERDFASIRSYNRASRKEYGTISGTMMLFVTGARSLTPVSAGILYTAFGRYEPVFWILVAVSLLAVGAVLLIETGLNTMGLPEGRMAQTS